MCSIAACMAPTQRELAMRLASDHHANKAAPAHAGLSTACGDDSASCHARVTASRTRVPSTWCPPASTARGTRELSLLNFATSSRPSLTVMRLCLTDLAQAVNRAKTADRPSRVRSGTTQVEYRRRFLAIVLDAASEYDVGRHGGGAASVAACADRSCRVRVLRARARSTRALRSLCHVL